MATNPTAIPPANVAPPATNPIRNAANTCATCLHFDGVQYCQRFPPVLTAQGNQPPNTYWMFPLTLATSWCGEWTSEPH